MKTDTWEIQEAALCCPGDEVEAGMSLVELSDMAARDVEYAADSGIIIAGGKHAVLKHYLKRRTEEENKLWREWSDLAEEAGYSKATFLAEVASGRKPEDIPFAGFTFI